VSIREKSGNKKPVSRVLTVERVKSSQLPLKSTRANSPVVAAALLTRGKHITARRSELSCRRTLEIDRYVDGELAPSDAAALRQHIDECAACNRGYQYKLALRSSLRDSSLYYRTPLELKMRVRSLSQTDAEAEASKRLMLPW
jgi:Putative zinc-finger